MNPPFHLPVLSFLLLVTAGRCFALMELEDVSNERARQLGIVVRSNGAGPDAVRVELAFDAKGELKDFERVDLEQTEGGKLLLAATLKQEKSAAAPAHIVVGFAADRARLEQFTLRAVTGSPGNFVGHDLRVKDFVVAQPPAAPAAAPAAPAAAPAAAPPGAGEPPAGAPAAPAAGAPPATPAPAAAPARAAPGADDEHSFLSAVRRAFDDRDASVLDGLTCWDNIPDKRMYTTLKTYAILVAQKGVVYDFTLVEPDRKFIDTDHVEDGVTYRANRPITKQLNMKGIDTRDKKTLFVLCYAVGEKDGKLVLVAQAPVK